MIEIKEIKTRRDIAKFAKYPIKLYKGCPYYVPSLRGDEKSTFNPKKNFSLGHCDAKGFLAYKDGELVGRIVGIINHGDNKINNIKAVRFSRFECIDDLEVFKALLGAVENYGKEHGMNMIHGPWGFNDTDREGVLTYGYDVRSTYATNYYYPYFAENMVKLGYADESKWLERKFLLEEAVPERMVMLAKRIQEKHGLVDVAETMSVKQILKKYGDKLFDTMTEAYRHLDGYVPIEGKERDNVLSQFATIVNTRYISILIDKNDNVAAFGIVLPSICDAIIKSKGKLFPFGFIGVLKSISKPKQLEMALIGVRDEYKNAGMNSIIIANVLKNIYEDKIELLESNPMLETNYNIQQTWKFIGTEIHKKRQTYQKPIE